MAKTVKFLGSVSNLSVPFVAEHTGSTQTGVVTFGGGLTARLDPLLEAFEVLRIAEQESLETIVTADELSTVPTTWAIRSATLALLTKVLGFRITESGDGEVLLRSSPRKRYLRVSHPAFHDLRERIRSALESGVNVAIAEDGDEIEDLIEYSGPPDETSQQAEFAVSAATAIKEWAKTPAPGAVDVFQLALDLQCGPPAIGSHCVPFSFPDDGCHARAHKVWHQAHMILGVNCGKVWLNADRSDPWEVYPVHTRNSPFRCEINWLYHVALVYSDGSKLRVIDPALFNRPATVSEWKNRQDPVGTVTFTTGDVYDRPQPGTYLFDRHLTGTESQLRYYRRKLRFRVSSRGFPPYKCS